MKTRLRNYCSLILLMAIPSSAAGEPLSVIFSDDFEKDMTHWVTTDPPESKAVWSIESTKLADKQNQFLRVSGPSKYKPPVRSPFSIAWLKDVVVGDFELAARVQNTNPGAGPHRDLCFFWGGQDASHFYYVHLGAKPDPHSCQIFIVNGKPRKAITKQMSDGIPWTDGWHRVKVRHEVQSGLLEVYFDDMQRPVMTAVDNTFRSGRIGLGTFDDSGNFDDVVLRGERIVKKSKAKVKANVKVLPTESGRQVTVDGKLFAEYVTLSGHQPIVWPILGPSQQPMTRSFPMTEPQADELQDHPHHRSLWFAHGDVNGHDFWLEPKADKAVVIQHREFVPANEEGSSLIVTRNDWLADGKKVCEDERRLEFGADPDGTRWIDFEITLKASDGPLTFGDTKEGTFSVRVAGPLKVDANLGGRLSNDTGLLNKAAWGQPAAWINNSGVLNERPAGVAMFGHPQNLRHPCRWHARNYGLLTANPFALHDFPQGEPRQGAFTIDEGKRLKLRYLVLLYEGQRTAEQIEKRYEAFATQHDDRSRQAPSHQDKSQAAQP